jgi:hypothetical protein
MNINNLFADDGVLIAKDYQSAQELLDICHDWSNHYGMSFSASKCAVMTEQTLPREIKLGAEVLPRLDQYTYLGIVMSSRGIDWEQSFAPRIAKAKYSHRLASQQRVE